MVRWTAHAKKDLKNIYQYISKDSVYYAKSVTNEIISKTKFLKDFQEIGRIVPEIGESNVRELLIYSYRIIYEISDDKIEILTIIHGRQDFNSTDFGK